MKKNDLKNLTYWDIMKNYHKVLYKSRLYWVSALLIAVGALSILCNIKYYPLGLTSALIGIILLIISKFKTMQEKISF